MSEETKVEETTEVVAETTAPAANDSGVDETVEIPKEFKKLVEEVESMTVLQSKLLRKHSDSVLKKQKIWLTLHQAM